FRQTTLLRCKSDFEAEIQIVSARFIFHDGAVLRALDLIVPICPQLKPIGQGTKSKQRLGKRVIGHPYARLVVERKGVSAFDLKNAFTDSFGRLGKIGSVGLERLVEWRTAFVLRFAVIPMQ